MRYALRYMRRYGLRYKYLDCYGRALNKCSDEHNLCINCGEMKKCVKMWSHLCEEKRFKVELKSIDFRQTHAWSIKVGETRWSPLEYRRNMEWQLK